MSRLQGAPTTKTKPCRSALQARSDTLGEVAEWSKAAVLKTVDRRRSVGSNPTLSAKNRKAPAGAFYVFWGVVGENVIGNKLVRAEHCAAVRDSVVAQRRRPRRGECAARVIPPSPPPSLVSVPRLCGAGRIQQEFREIDPVPGPVQAPNPNSLSAISRKFPNRLCWRFGDLASSGLAGISGNSDLNYVLHVLKDQAT